jgi:plastocyanin
MKKINLCLLILVSSFSMIFSMDSYATLYSITVQNYVFTPSNLLSVKVGDTLRWVWVNGLHTTTSTNIPSGAATWDSQVDATHLTFDYIPAHPGDYHYQCTYDVALGMIGQFTVLNNSGISDPLPFPEITVYPNPVGDRVWLKWNDADGVFIQHLSICNVTGIILREASFKEGNAFPEYFDLSGLPAGMLVFTFTDNLNRKAVRKAVKSN